MEILRIVTILLLSLFPSLCLGQLGGECVGDLLASDPIFRNCSYTVLPALQETLNTDNGKGILRVLCGPDLRPSLDCTISSMAQCPDDLVGFLSGLGIDPADFMEFGGFDLPCSLFNGQCENVQQCFPQVTLQSITSGVDGVSVLVPGPAETNDTTIMPGNFSTPLAEFYDTLTHLCGMMKLEFDCGMREFSKCASLLEEDMERQIPLFVADVLIADSHRNFSAIGPDVLYLLQSYCPASSAQDLMLCKLDSLESQTFVDCYDDAMMNYDNRNHTDACSLRDDLTTCTVRHVRNPCGETATGFLLTQIPVFLRSSGMPCVFTTTTTTTMAPTTTTLPSTMQQNPTGPAMPTNGDAPNQQATNPNQSATDQKSNSATRFLASYLVFSAVLSHFLTAAIRH